MIERLQRALATVDGVVFAYLFGSQARGTARPDSDIDLAVHLGGRDRTELHFELCAALNLVVPVETIHLIILDDAPPALVYRVMRDGKLLVDRDRVARTRFLAIHLSRYQDMEHVRRLFAEADARRARHG